jgi:hypothetical protein
LPEPDLSSPGDANANQSTLETASIRLRKYSGAAEKAETSVIAREGFEPRESDGFPLNVGNPPITIVFWVWRVLGEASEVEFIESMPNPLG